LSLRRHRRGPCPAGVLVGRFEADHDLRRLLGVRAGTTARFTSGDGMPVAGRTRRTCLRRNAGRCGRGSARHAALIEGGEDGATFMKLGRAPTMWSRFTKSPVERIFSLNHLEESRKRESGFSRVRGHLYHLSFVSEAGVQVQIAVRMRLMRAQEFNLRFVYDGFRILCRRSRQARKMAASCLTWGSTRLPRG